MCLSAPDRVTQLQEPANSACSRARYALIVDDSRAQRRILAHHLRDWGYITVEAASGTDALALCAEQHFDLVLSDWIMPGMTGVEFCEEFRRRPSEAYSYFILLTSKNDKNAVAEGLDVGADDFLSKPVSYTELRARIFAGERLLDMERKVRRANEDLRTTLAELRAVHDALDRDLQEARKLQHALIRERLRRFHDSEVGFLLQSSGHVGGDLIGAFRICEDRVGIFSIDVSGHGVAAAMLSARLSALFSDGAQGQNIAITTDPQTGNRLGVPPETVAARMNDLMLQEMETETYLTLAYADLNLATGQARLVQAGHPHPAIQRKCGKVEFIGEGGLPIGLIPQAIYSGFDVQLSPGDRLFLYSDGITECRNLQNTEFGEDRLGSLMLSLSHLRCLSFLDALKWELGRWSGKEEFSDDVSGVVLEFQSIATAPDCAISQDSAPI